MNNTTLHNNTSTLVPGAGVGAAAAAADDDVGQKLAWSLFWGLVSSVSLPIGALLGIWRLPSERLRAAMMAFGGGALLFALTIELFGESLAESEHEPEKQRYVILVMSAAAIIGGLLFNFLDTLLNSKGAFVTNATAFQARVKKARIFLARSKLKQL